MRLFLFIVGAIITFIPVIKLSLKLNHPGFFIGWGIALLLIQIIIFRCPHCGNHALITKYGMNTPFVGAKCRYCGKDY